MIVELNKGARLRPFQVPFFLAFSQGAKRISELEPRQHGKTHSKVEFLHSFLHEFRHRKYPEALVLMSTEGQVKKYYVRPLVQWFRDNKYPEKLIKIKQSKQGAVQVELIRPWLEDIAYIDFGGMKNLDAIRGGTRDFIIVDEAHSAPYKAYDQVIEPQGDDTDALVVLCGTASRIGFFKHCCEYYDRMYKEGDNFYRHIEFDAVSARLRSDMFLRRRFLDRFHKDTLETWHSEYMNDWNAATAGENPFSHGLAELSTNKYRLLQSNSVQNDKSKMYAVMDLGAAQNQPMIFFKRNELNKFFAVGYDNSRKLLWNVPELLMDKYGDHRQIELFVPFDIHKESNETGQTLYQNLLKKIRELGLSSRIKVTPLKKSTDKKAQIMTAIECLPSISFIEPETRRLREMMGGVRFRVDPNTAHVLFGEYVRNKERHTGDAFCYMVDAILNYISKGITTQLNYSKRDNRIFPLNIGTGLLTYDKLKVDEELKRKQQLIRGFRGVKQYWTRRP